MQIDFEALKAFTYMDQDQDGLIDSNEISKFMKQQYIRVSQADAELIIKEFDGNLDGNLDF